MMGVAGAPGGPVKYADDGEMKPIATSAIRLIIWAIAAARTPALAAAPVVSAAAAPKRTEAPG